MQMVWMCILFVFLADELEEFEFEELVIPLSTMADSLIVCQQRAQRQIAEDVSSLLTHNYSKVTAP